MLAKCKQTVLTRSTRMLISPALEMFMHMLAAVDSGGILLCLIISAVHCVEFQRRRRIIE